MSSKGEKEADDEVKKKLEEYKSLFDEWSEMLNRENVSYNMFCDDHRHLLNMIKILLDKERSRIFGQVAIPKELLVNIVQESPKYFKDFKKFEVFMIDRLRMFGARHVVKLSISDEFKSLMNKATTDEKSIINIQLLLDLMSFMTCSPVETIFLLVTRAIDCPNMLPLIGLLLSKNFRSVCVYTDEVYPQSILTSIMQQKTSYEVKQQEVFNLIKELYKSKYRKFGVPVFSLELLVIRWLKGFHEEDAIFIQIGLLHQLIVSNVTGKEKWSRIKVPEMVMYFLDAFMTTRRNPEMKELIFQTLSLVINNHIERKINDDEMKEIVQKSKDNFDMDEVYINYLEPLVENPIAGYFNFENYNTSEKLLLVAISGTKNISNAEFLNNSDIVSSMSKIMNFLTKEEITRLTNFGVSEFNLLLVIGLWINVLLNSFDDAEPIQKVSNHLLEYFNDNLDKLEEVHDEEQVEREREFVIKSIQSLIEEIGSEKEHSSLCGRLRDLTSAVQQKPKTSFAVEDTKSVSAEKSS